MRLRHVQIRYTRSQAAEQLTAGWQRWPPVARPEWRPPCDLYETAAGWIVKAEIAGLDEQDVEVLLYEGGLVVEGHRPWRAPAEGEDARVHAAEIHYGPFRLALELPAAVDRDGASASYERGLLVLRLPRARSA